MSVSKKLLRKVSVGTYRDNHEESEGLVEFQIIEF